MTYIDFNPRTGRWRFDLDSHYDRGVRWVYYADDQTVRCFE